MIAPHRIHALIAAVPLLIGCTEPPPESRRAKSDHTWSDQQEVIYQLREVIRYEDDQEWQRREALQNLALPVDAAPPSEPAVATGKGDDQGQQ